MSIFIFDRRDGRNAFVRVADVFMTTREFAELVPEYQAEFAKLTEGLPEADYVRHDYAPGWVIHTVTKPDGSQALLPRQWAFGDNLLLRGFELDQRVRALRASKGHPEHGARRPVPDEVQQITTQAPFTPLG